MTVTDDKMLAEEAQRILDEGEAQGELQGLDTDTKVTILGTNFSTSDEFVLGARVVLRVTGYVSLEGKQLIENGSES